MGGGASQPGKVVVAKEEGKVRKVNKEMAAEIRKGNVAYIQKKLDGSTARCVDEEGHTLLALAILNQQQEIADLLLSNPEVDVNAPPPAELPRGVPPGPAPLQVACSAGDHAMVYRLLAVPSIQVNQKSGPNGDTALIAACAALPTKYEKDPADIINQLLERRDIEVGLPSDAQATPLHSLAARPAYVHLMDDVMGMGGVDVNGGTTYMYTPLMLACRHNAVPVVERLLVSDKIDLNAITSPNAGTCRFQAGYTALHMCALDSRPACAKLILEHPNKCNVDIPAVSGETPLHVAANHARDSYGVDMVRMLLESDADPKRHDGKVSESRTPSELAWERRNKHPHNTYIGEVAELMTSAVKGEPLDKPTGYGLLLQ